ncbi:hypothetical protein [Longicatena caecimuris]|uniref:hypothetical protein n=1 Tax=Longicatena caecimuris TaxID=1796635 RepID=UPI003993CB44
MQGIFQKENTDKALKYGIYRHLPTYEKIIRNLVSFLSKNINDRLVQSKILKFFHKVIELPDMDEGISPRGVIMGNGTGVISQLEMHNFNFDIRML